LSIGVWACFLALDATGAQAMPWNVASRMETTGAEGKIQVFVEAYERLKQTLVLQKRCRINVKGKGRMQI
jgi:hypothetical protein